MKKINWLLLRGLGRESAHWGDFLPLLQQQVSTGEVRSLDLPGVGSENHRICPLNMRDIVEDLRGRWSASKKAGDWGVIAISFGGMIALDWQDRYPGDFAKLVLINTSMKGVCRLFERIRPAALSEFLKILFLTDVYQREKKILELTAQNLNKDKFEEIFQKWAQIAIDRPIARSTFLRQLYAASQVRIIKQSIVPKLFVASAKDQIANPVCSENLAGILGGKCVVHPAAGHDLPLEQPHWLTQEIGKFI